MNIRAASLESLLWMFQLREAVASVSLSHKENCDCTICRAGKGDEEAMAEIIASFGEREP